MENVSFGSVTSSASIRSDTPWCMLNRTMLHLELCNIEPWSQAAEANDSAFEHSAGLCKRKQFLKRNGAQEAPSPSTMALDPLVPTTDPRTASSTYLGAATAKLLQVKTDQNCEKKTLKNR